MDQLVEALHTVLSLGHFIYLVVGVVVGLVVAILPGLGGRQGFRWSCPSCSGWTSPRRSR